MTPHARKRLLWTGFVLATLGFVPIAPQTAHAGLAALDAFHVGRYHLANGDREQALESFNDALRLNPQFVQAYVARGKLYAELGQHESALVDLNFALRLQPTHAEAFAYRGYATLSLGQPQKALPDLDMALRIDPSYARVHFLRGQALQLIGDRENAATSIAMARRLDPTLEVSQVVAAGNDGSIDDVGVQLTGGTSPQRTPVMTELMPRTESAASPDRKSLGRVVPFQAHPALADVRPPRMSRPLETSVFSGSPKMLERAEARASKPQATALLSPPPAVDVSPIIEGGTYSSLPGAIASKPGKNQEPPAEIATSLPENSDKLIPMPPLDGQESEAEIDTSMPKVETTTPATIVELPSTNSIVESKPTATPTAPVVESPATEELNVETMPTPESEVAVAETAQEEEAATIDMDLKDAAPTGATPTEQSGSTEPAVPTGTGAIAEKSPADDEDSTPVGDEGDAVADQQRQMIPAFGPQIFAGPGIGGDPEQLTTLPASEILRGSVAENFVLPEKPSSFDGENRLAAAVEAAKLATTLDVPQAYAGDEGELDEAAAVQAPTSEQVAEAAAHFRRGLQLEAEGKTSEALAAYQQSLQLNPTDAQVFCRRGHLLLEDLRTAEALADFEQAVKLAPGMSNGYFGRAHVRYETESYAEAIYDYSIALRLDDQHAQALFERGYCHHKLGATDKAKADRRAALDLDPSLAKAEPKYAVDSASPAKPVQPVMIGATAYADDSGIAPVTVQMKPEALNGATAIASDAEEQASQTESAPAADADAAPSTRSALDTLFYDDETNEAARAKSSANGADVAPASSRGPNLSPAESKELKLEILRLTEELSAMPGDRDRYFRRARAYCRMGQSESAIDDLNAALRFSPDSVEAYALRASAYEHVGQLDAAKADYDHMVRLIPDNAAALIQRAKFSAEIGDFESALADLELAAGFEPDNAAVFHERSRVYAESGEFDRSQADRQRALEIEAASR